MVVISRSIIVQFSEKYPDSFSALLKWYEITKESNWKDFSEMKRSFNSVDAVGNDRYVFDIKGNQYRLIVLNIFKVRTVFILFIGTHQDYDQIDAKQVSFKK